MERGRRLWVKEEIVDEGKDILFVVRLHDSSTAFFASTFYYI